MPEPIRTEDWHKADVKAALEKAGLSLSRLARDNGLQAGTFRKVFVVNYPKAQRVIADALRLRPWDIWPSRYPSDKRLPEISHSSKPSNGKPRFRAAA